MTFEERYADLLFIQELAEDKEITEWPAVEHIPRDDVEGLYIYGLTMHIDKVRPWLEEHQDRRLLFIEDDASRIKAFLKKGGGDLFSHPRIHLHYKMPEGSWEVFLEELATHFPLRHIQCLVVKPDTEFTEHQMTLIRKTIVQHGYHVEMLRYHKLFRNLHRNAYQLAHSCDVGKWKDALKGIPAIVCGAGPSLMSVLPQLKQCENKGVIFAGGSTIRAFGNLRPHLALALDPNPEELERVKYHTAFEVPLLYGLRVQSDIFRESNNPLGYIESGTGGPVEEWLEQQLDIHSIAPLEGLSTEALTITLVGIRLALHFGCNPIILNGVDLAYGKGKHYADGVVNEQQLLLEDKEQYALMRHGVKTLAKWVMEGDVISQLAKNHPETTFIDGTGQGLPIEGVTRQPFAEIDLNNSYDIRAKLHRITETTKYNLTKAHIDNALNTLYESLCRCRTIVSKLIKETEEAKRVVWEMDLHEELAYRLCLQLVQAALQTERAQCYHKELTEEDRCKMWSTMHDIIEEYIMEMKK